MKKILREIRRHFFPTLGILFLGILITFPFYWMVSTSFKSIAESVAFPPKLFPSVWRIDNYKSLIENGDFGFYLRNSMIYSGGIGIGVAITSCLAGYAFANLKFPGKNVLFSVLLISLMIPPELIAIPNFIIINKIGLYNTYFGLILPNIANAFSIFLLRQAFMSLPKDFFDSASIDGCSHLRFLLKIGVPLIWPTIVVVTFLSFVRAWNDLLWPLITVSGKSMYTVQVGLLTFSQQAASNFPLLMTGSTIAILPVIILFLFVQKSVIENFAQSGLQGI